MSSRPAREAVRAVLPASLEATRAIGVAGTFVSLAALAGS